MKLNASRWDLILQSPWTWAAASLCFMVAFCVYFQFDGLYGQDAYAYLDDARHLKAWMKGGDVPPDFFWTRGYSGVGAMLGMVFGDPWLPMLALSMLSVCGTVMVCIRWAHEMHGVSRLHGPLLFLMIGFSPFLFRNGVTIMSDTWAIFWATLFAWMAWRYRQDTRLKHLAFALLAAGLAVVVRFALAPLLLIPAIQIGLHIIRQRQWLHMALLPLALLPILPELLLSPGGPSTLAHPTAIAFNPANLFRSEFVNIDGQFQFAHWNITQVLQAFYHPGYLGLALPIAFLATLFVRKRLQLPGPVWGLLLPASAYLFFLACLVFQNDRFLLPVVPPLALFVLPPLAALAKAIPWRWLALLVLTILHVFLMTRATRALRTQNELEKAVLAEIQGHPGHRVYTLGMHAMLSVRAPEIPLGNLFHDTIPPIQAGDLLLSDFSKSYPQWQDMTPGRHWREIQASQTLQPLKSFEHDWILYAVD